MNQEELMLEIASIEREIALLPEGSITKKKIRDRDYFYHRVTRNGKREEKYIDFEVVGEMKTQIERRKRLEKYLKELKKQIDSAAVAEKEVQHEYRTIVSTGNRLRAQIALAARYKKRECFSKLREYVFGDLSEKVFVIYGLRRTGKTTMIRQALEELPEAEFCKAAVIQVRSKDTLEDVDADLRLLEAKGFKYIFIDEVTLMEDFIEGAAIFSDIYASSGMKIVLSGTDSLGFAFSKEEQLYDRCIMMHTTFIPYREFEAVLGIKGIDEYIRYGGTMSLSGRNYNENAIFATAQGAEEYIDTAIAKNIQHSLRLYEYGGHFRSLLDLYEKGELTNVINRVIENMNHRFTKRVVEQTFQSRDIELEQTVQIKDHHMAQIEEYLTLLDLIMKIDLEFLPDIDHRSSMTVLTQPGMRYAQAEAIVSKLLLDKKFSELSLVERQRILERLLGEIRGRMMEEIVLLETKMACPKKKVFKLQFAVGEFDMVVFDPEELCCEIYEVKYSKEQVPEQGRHLRDQEKCEMTSHRYGDIRGKYIIYRGENSELDGVKYLNIEEYLKTIS